jgi:DDE superfamily endonuclease
MAAGTATPPLVQSSPAARPALPQGLPDVVDPADAQGVRRLCRLLRRGQADLYGQDEADLALLPTLTRLWMPRGQQRRIPAPGINEKRSVSAAVDVGDGGLLWRTDDKRTARQFTATVQRCARRSTRRGRLAILLVDNAPSHQVGQTGIVRTALDRLAGRVVLVFLPTYSPDLEPAELLWRQWRPHVTHNHTRATLVALQQDSDGWLRSMARRPAAVLQALGLAHAPPSSTLPKVA